MKLILTLAFASSIFIGNSQTPLISHKSHSGSSGSYLISSTSNFGNLPLDRYPTKPIIYENFKTLNDSVVVLEFTNAHQKVIKIDTLKNQNKYPLVVFKYKYQDSIQQKEIQEYNQKAEQEENQIQEHQIQSEQKLVSDPVPSKKKKKKSYLLFLFGITGGGMLLMTLFRKSKSNQQSIA